MPGVKSINWTEVNKAKVLDAVLFYHGNIKVENEVAAQIAQHMGAAPPFTSRNFTRLMH